MTTPGQQYIPGVCNIGRSEIKKRRALAWIGLVATAALAILFVLLRSPALWRLWVFLPAMLSALGFLQSAWHFCAKFGLRGEFKFGPTIGKSGTQQPAESRKKDRRTALLVIGLSAMIGAVTAAAAYFVPL
jgi:uncharacterized membrane protein YbhN (UPF0104 family)